MELQCAIVSLQRPMAAVQLSPTLAARISLCHGLRCAYVRRQQGDNQFQATRRLLEHAVIRAKFIESQAAALLAEGRMTRPPPCAN
jgi:hypothetical protein